MRKFLFDTLVVIGAMLWLDIHVEYYYQVVDGKIGSISIYWGIIAH